METGESEGEAGNGNDYDVVRTAANLHAVVIPLPTQGHITPALLLAKKLVGLGFRVTFVNTTHNHEKMVKVRSKAKEPEKGISFVSVSDGLPDDYPRLRRAMEFFDAILAMGPVFEALLLKLQHLSPITCVIRDIRFPAVHDSARKLGIPVVGFATASCIATHCAFNVPLFLSRGILPLPPPPAHSTPSVHPVDKTMGPPRSEEEAAARDARLAGVLPGVSPTMRVEHIPTHLLSHDVESFWTRQPLMFVYECLLFNSFQDIEGDILDAMVKNLNPNVLAIGPLNLNLRTTKPTEDVAIAEVGSALLEEDPVALSWLDNQSPNSVLFVSFGSSATPSVEQMREFAHGLEMSGHAFLWAIRSESIKNFCELNKDFETLFSEFVIRTRVRALVVSWAPQAAVLSHSSVAAFLSHCGWNSTMESVASGVPMLGWPRFADQTTNCHYITQVWGIGLELQSWKSAEDGMTLIVPKEEVDRKVRKMMAREEETEPEVEKIRINSRELAMAARKAVAKGGSSHAAMAKFAELVESWRIKR